MPIRCPIWPASTGIGCPMPRSMPGCARRPPPTTAHPTRRRWCRRRDRRRSSSCCPGWCRRGGWPSSARPTASMPPAGAPPIIRWSRSSRIEAVPDDADVLIVANPNNPDGRILRAAAAARSRPRPPAGGRRGVRRRRPGHQPGRLDRPSDVHRAALVRQVLRPRRDAAGLCPAGRADGRAAAADAGTVGGQRTGGGGGRGGAGRCSRGCARPASA